MLCDLQPNLLSAHRKFVQKLNVLEVGEELRGKGTTITLFIFTDSLEVGFYVQLNVIFSNFCMNTYLQFTRGFLFVFAA